MSNTTETHPGNEIYRIRLTKHVGSSKQGETVYYTGQDRDRMRADILKWKLEEDANHSLNPSRGINEHWLWTRLADAWYRMWYPAVYEGDEIPPTHQIHGIEKHTGEGWVPCEVSYTAPSITFEGVTTSRTAALHV